MQYKIIVDKQPRTNPTTEKREYIIDIEELRVKGDIFDSLIITKGEDYVIRRLNLSEYGVLSVLDEPIKEPLPELNIELFEGENYIYIQDMVGNKFYAEYLVKNDFTDLYVTVNQMNSAITQTAGQIELTVNQKLTEYATTEEMNSAITEKANEINLEVKKKVNNEDLTGANIALRINSDESEVQINADKININGVISANNNFQIKKDGSIETRNGSFIDGEIKIKGGTEKKPNIAILDNLGNVRSYLAENGLGIHFNNSKGFFEISEYYALLQLIFNDDSGIQLDATNEEAMMTISGSSGNSTTVSNDYIVTPVLTQTSRAESKKNFEKLENGLNILKQVDIYKYNLKNEEDNSKKHIGFVIGDNYKYAHEITAEDENGKEIGVDTYSMISVLWKAVQELTEKVERLEAKNEES